MLKKAATWFFYLVLLLLLAAGSGYLSYRLILRNKMVSVPGLTGQSPEAASASLQDAGLKLRIEGKAFDPVVPPGDIQGQEPGPGRQVRINSTVKVIISEGPETKRMPSVLGLTAAQAVSLLGKEDLVAAEVIQVRSNRIPAGVVIAQNPQPEEKTGPVRLIASAGPGEVSYYCPDFRQMTVAKAQGICQALGLDPVFVGGGSGSKTQTVNGQSPAPGSKVMPGQKVFMELQ